MTHSTPGGPGRDGEPGYDDLLPLAYPDSRPPRRRRRGGRVALTLLMVVTVAVIASVAAVKAFPRKTVNPAGYHTSARSPGASAERITAAFLRAWSGGDIGRAAGLTDDPSAARAGLTAYSADLHLRKLDGAVTGASEHTAEGGTGTGVDAATVLESVTYRLDATVAGSAAAGATSGTWSYHSTLTAYQVPDGTGWYIWWDPSVLAPGLSGGQHLGIAETRSPDVTVTDSAGNPLSRYSDPGLATIDTLLAGRTAEAGPGAPGLSVQIEDPGGQAVPGSQAPLTAPGPGRITTTISPRAEQAAISAVAGADNSAIAVIQPSTGHILAIANSPGGNDFALTAQVAPGSVMKIITATALLNSGAVTASSPVACPVTETVQGVTYHNDQNESEPAGTPFATDFARSCNNAFDQWWQRLDGSLAETARTYYGLGQPWSIGIGGESATYFSAPANPSGAEVAEESFGEGRLTTCPLAMASVAATVDEGRFRQPVLVPGASAAGGSAAGTPAVSARPLPASTDTQLKQMMRDVVTEGTAAGVGLGPDVYAKTGTAGIQGQEQPNAWMVAFDPGRDVAVAALVINAGDGAQAAGPEVRTFLDGY